MGGIKGSIRNELKMYCLEQWVDLDSEVRFFDVFVDSMDLEELGFTIREANPIGRNAYSTKSLVKLYMYGYYNDIRSSRKLEKACRVNLEVKWLIREVCPSHKTIAEFRRLNIEGFTRVFDHLMSFLKQKGLFTKETTIAVDGTRLHSQNSKLKNFDEKKLKHLISRAEKQIEQYLEELEQTDQIEDQDSEKKNTKSKGTDDKPKKPSEQPDKRSSTKEEKLEKLQQNLNQNKARYEQLKQCEDDQISCTDSDSRRIGRVRESAIIGYNGQIATTGESKLIVSADVKNKPDTNTLAQMAKQAQNNMGKEKLNVLADCGFSEAQQLYICQQAGLTTFVPSKPAPYAKQKGKFAKSKFIYEQEKDIYRCPNNKELTTTPKWYTRNSKGRKPKRYKEYVVRDNGCVDCPFRNKCQTTKEIQINKQKNIRQYEHEEYRIRSNQRAKQNPSSYKKRKAIVEHPFGTMKRSMHFTYFLLKGLKKVNAEFRLICSCYNIKRLIKIYGVKKLNEALNTLILHLLAISANTMDLAIHNFYFCNQLHIKSRK